MTQLTEIEERVSLWFEEDAVTQVPDRFLEDTFKQTRALPQARPSLWRTITLSRTVQYVAIAGAGVIVVMAGALAAFNMLRPQLPPGMTPLPSIQPTLSQPPATPPVPATVTFTSPLYEYSVDVPGDWTFLGATKVWSGRFEHEPDQASADMFRIGPAAEDAGVAVKARVLPDRTNAGAWIGDWEAIFEEGGRCLGNGVWTDTTVASLPARVFRWRCEGSPNASADYDMYAFAAGRLGYVVSGKPSMVAVLVDSFRTSAWKTYLSSQYGFTIGYPTGWNVDPADRAWDLQADAADALSPATDDFTAPTGDIRVSAWSVPVTEDVIPAGGGRDELEAWIMDYCEKSGASDCARMLDETVSLCIELLDCHPGVLVTSAERDIQAFMSGGIYANEVLVVTIWRSMADPSLDRFGGGQPLIQRFLTPMCVWPENRRPEQEACFGIAGPTAEP